MLLLLFTTKTQRKLFILNTIPRKLGEVMWPRLIASKILRKSLGSNNFVADFPTANETSTDFSCFGEQSISCNSLFNDRFDAQNYKVFVSTWNVGGVAPSENVDMEELLDTDHTPCDIYVLGFQEIVPLTASNVLGSENCKITNKWNSLIREALNNKSCMQERNECGGNLKSKIASFPTRDGISMGNGEFWCIISKQMVGIFISVWVRNDLQPYIQNANVSCIGCGFMSCLGNKGSVSVRFRLHETSFCFVCSHLASGGRVGDEKYRNANAKEVFLRTSFPSGHSRDLPRKILDHDRVILLGDLNYRISQSPSAIREFVDKQEWNDLLKTDQLRVELMDGEVFEDWHEGAINFAPTYKYYPNSDEYYGCSEGKRGEKKRVPAWCDRIIWYGVGLKQLLYSRGESRLSDHRPVKAIFATEVEIKRRLKYLQGFFWSERFDPITTSNSDSSSTSARLSFQFV